MVTSMLNGREITYINGKWLYDDNGNEVKTYKIETVSLVTREHISFEMFKGKQY